jgi:beta-lactamase class A
MSRSEELRAALEARVADTAARLNPGTLGVGVYDYLSGFAWSRTGDRWFHAASLIKIAVLAALFDAVERGRFTLDCRLHVRNRFLSILDGQPFSVDRTRDADSDVHAAVGRTLRLSELARHMIVTSSNLATNLLLDLVGLDEARAAIARRGIEGIDLQRGVEDERAFEAGRNNRVTPDGVVDLLRSIFDSREFSDVSSKAMVDILSDQQFGGGIAPGLPDPIRSVARVAHKTGDISAVSHDAGLVFLPGRPPYVVAILCESDLEGAQRTAALAAVSGAVYEAVASAGETTWR